MIRHNVFNKNNINAFDILTFIQIRAILTDKNYDSFKASKQLSMA